MRCVLFMPFVTMAVSVSYDTVMSHACTTAHLGPNSFRGPCCYCQLSDLWVVSKRSACSDTFPLLLSRIQSCIIA